MGDMKENGKMVIEKDMEYFIILREVDMKENLKMIILIILLINIK